MRSYSLFCIALTTLAGLFVLVGLYLPAMLLFPAPVAYCWVRERSGWALVLLACAALLPVVITGALGFGLAFLVTALLGLLAGALVRARVSLGVCVAVVSVLLFALLAGHTAVYWSEAHQEWSAVITAQLERAREQDASARGEQAEAVLQWLDENWPYVSFGVLFGGILIGTTAVCSALYRCRDVAYFSGVRNIFFSAMRPNEHLVWIAIALAGLWFFDRQWPNEGIRFVAWNGAVAMTALYWLNGLSIAVFAILAFNVRPVLGALLLFGLFVMNLHHVFAVIGLFDTWWHFRIKTLQIVRAREAKRDNGSDAD